MGITQAIILGLVQGLGEFLPISSSAHLIITSWILSWEDQGLAYDVALHWGTLFAVVIYFRKELINIAKGFIFSLLPTKRNLITDFNQRLAWLIIVATLPAMIAGKLFEVQVATILRSPITVIVTLTLGALIIFAVERWGSKLKQLTELTWKNALVIGLAQAISIIPGVSRSGSTIMAALGIGLTRDQAARFSFLLSAPIILGAGLLELPAIFNEPNLWVVFIGFVSAFVFGFIAIHFLLRYVATRSFSIFAWYRLALAALVLAVYLSR
ncbi:MAG TPA: undecaprenyl-diphosphatase UppP [Candidatus Doudnabacteria bacterium]|nr:undecaprenyl-diphosphatase UppP [Candidatus Doudnabacteria bacterium]